MKGGSLAFHNHQRNDHFLEAYPTMLESIFIIIHVLVVVIGITEKYIFTGKNVTAVYIWYG
jgi:hypothetical protein